MKNKPSDYAKNEPSFAAVLLAAGYASRFGRCKAAATIEGLSILTRCVEAFRRGGVQDVVVVTGAWEDEVRSAAPRGSCRFVRNPRFDSGMFSSVRAGLDAAGHGCDGVFIHPVDVPLILPSTVRKLTRAFTGEKAEKWFVPTLENAHENMEGRRAEGYMTDGHVMGGHPILIPRSWKKSIKNWTGEGGLRNFLALHEKERVRVPVFDEGVLLDVDTPEDLDRLIRWSRRRHVPRRSTIESLLELAKTPQRVVSHQRRVAEVASRVGQLCGRASVDLDLLNAAAELHDILKTESAHAKKGADFLEENGFPEVAELVRVHTDLSPKATIEAEILYLADKYVNGTEVHSLREREQRVRQRFADNREALETALYRMKVAIDIEKHLEKLTGVHPLLQYVT
ncbi:MAG: NTP transferase domain-containing protein [Synergistaceae bacterium]|jgi:probable phosphoglycerate mutase|nr:NTP transferase domain-containing protein [Synergistaceae bacterium]